MEEFTITSNYDGLILGVSMKVPKNPKGIIQLVHGMAEHRKRYYDVMKYFYHQGYITIIHDHRGHGNSVKDQKDWGYFYENGSEAVVEDVYQITRYIKEKYPNLPFFLFGHSMGSLIVRCYTKKYDHELNGLIVCGSPSYNPGAKAILPYIHAMKKIKGSHHRSNMIQILAFGLFNKNFQHEKSPNAWICSNQDVVANYDKDPACGFIFTLNGFETLFKLVNQTYSKKGWKLSHPDLPILFLAGKEDPCIMNEKHFHKAIQSMQKVGYHNLTGKLYDSCRHEILNETIKEDVYQDILAFIQ